MDTGDTGSPDHFAWHFPQSVAQLVLFLINTVYQRSCSDIPVSSFLSLISGTRIINLLFMNFLDILSLAFRTVRSNKLRTGLTVAIIAFGIMALIGIITAIKAMNQKFTESFSTMGANAFTIRFKERNIRFWRQ